MNAATNRGDPVLHVLQPPADSGVIHIETGAIVRNGEEQLSVLVSQVDDDAQGLRIHPRTECPSWLGESLSVGYAIDVLHPLAQRPTLLDHSGLGR